MTPRKPPEPDFKALAAKWLNSIFLAIIAFFLMDSHAELKDHGKQIQEIKIDVSSLKTDMGNVKDNVKNLVITTNEKEMRDLRERDEETLKDNGK